MTALFRLPRPGRKVSPLACDEVRAELPAVLDREGSAQAGLVEHVEYCLSCQAELARYRRLVRLLHQLRSSEATLAPGVVSDVLAAIEQAASRRAVRSVLTGRRLAYASAVVVGVGVAIFVLGLTRAHRHASEVDNRGLKPAL